MRVAEGRKRPLTAFTACDMVFMRSQTRLQASTTDFYRWRRALRQKSGKRARSAL